MATGLAPRQRVSIQRRISGHSRARALSYQRSDVLQADPGLALIFEQRLVCAAGGIKERLHRLRWDNAAVGVNDAKHRSGNPGRRSAFSADHEPSANETVFTDEQMHELGKQTSRHRKLVECPVVEASVFRVDYYPSSSQGADVSLTTLGRTRFSKSLYDILINSVCDPALKAISLSAVSSSATKTCMP